MKIYVLMDLFFPPRPRSYLSNKFPFCFGIAIAVVFVLRFEGVFEGGVFGGCVGVFD